MITYKELHQMFIFDVHAGLLIRREAKRAGVGHPFIAGYVRPDGYRVIKIKDKNYLAHRLIWLMTTGAWPVDGIDHEDGFKDNNRLDNIRDATQLENTQNQAMRSDNTSGVLGVHWNKQRQKWRAQIVVGGKQKHLGRFTDKQEAIDARKDAERLYGFHPNHGRTS